MKGSVLVIDDEEALANAIRRFLSSAHDVTVATRVADARALIASGTHFDVIICDLMLPDGTGMELHAELKASDPALADRMVFATGGAYTEAAMAFLAAVPNLRVEKPFNLRELRVLVGTLIPPG
jgi:DNA-binding response OmpR family regulator